MLVHSSESIRSAALDTKGRPRCYVSLEAYRESNIYFKQHWVMKFEQIDYNQTLLFSPRYMDGTSTSLGNNLKNVLEDFDRFLENPHRYFVRPQQDDNWQSYSASYVRKSLFYNEVTNVQTLRALGLSLDRSQTLLGNRMMSDTDSRLTACWGPPGTGTDRC